MTSAQPTPVEPSPGTSALDGGSASDTAIPSPAAGGPPVSSSAPLNTQPLTKDEVAALQSVLQAENAAIWAYALVAAHDADDASTVAAMRAAHLVARDAAASRLLAGGGKPAAPAPVYSTPKVTDAASARALAITIETDCARAWHSVVGRTDRTDLRSAAAGGLTEAAVRTVQWKQLAKAATVTVPFPGEAT